MKARSTRVGWIIVIALLTFLSIEGGARLLALRLGPATQWFSPSAHERVAFLESDAFDAAGINVLFAGSSVVASGFDAARYDEITGNSTANMALPSTDIVVTDQWLTNEVLPRADGSTTITRVVYGLTTLAMNDNAAVPASARYSQQTATSPGWRGSLHRFMFERFALVRYADTWGDPASAIRDLADPPDADDYTTPFFDTPLPPAVDLTLVDDPNQLRTNGLLDFDFGIAEREALRHLFAELSARDVEVVLVLTPVHSDYAGLHPFGQQDFDAARREIEAEAARAGATFIDLSDAVPDTDFIDHLHVNRSGIRTLTDLIACKIDAACD